MSSTSASILSDTSSDISRSGGDPRATIRRRRVVGTLAVGLLAGSTIFVGAAPAQAAQTGVAVVGGVLKVEAGTATANNITISGVFVGLQFRYQVTDTGGTLVTGAGCSKVNSNTARCASNVSSVDIKTHDGNDRVTLKVKLSSVVNAGTGNDIVNGDAGNDTVFGGAGDDTVYGWSGIDTVYGGTGKDTVYAHNGDDYVYGQDGDDRLYGEGGHDRMYGGTGVDTVYGGVGNDVIRGEDGNDRIYGQDGNDYIYGQSGADTMYGQVGKDWMYGGPQNDTVDGGTGDDELHGDDGDDRLYGRDNVAFNDRLWGDKGSDYCDADRGDAKQTCETS